MSRPSDMVIRIPDWVESQTRHRVLLVDDDASIRLMLRTKLSFVANIEVVGEAANGLEAVAMVHALSPDAVVVDLNMPVMRGDEAIPLMRTVLPGLRVVMFTGSQRAVIAALQPAARPDRVVHKGRPLSELVHQLVSLLNEAPVSWSMPALGPPVV